MATIKVHDDPISGVGTIRCPSCPDLAATRVIDSRGLDNGAKVRRRRVCPRCGHRFTTYECLAHPEIASEVANIRTAHLDRLIASLKTAIEEYEHIRTHPDETTT